MPRSSSARAGSPSSSARIAFNDGLGLSESEDGAVGLEETVLRGSPLGGIVERGDGGVGLTLAEVLESGGVGVAERGRRATSPWSAPRSPAPTGRG